MKNKRMALKTKIMGLSVGMMVIMASITVLMIQVLNSKQRNIAEGNMEVYSQGLAAAVGAQFKQRYGDIQAFASNAIMLYADTGAITEVLNKYVELYDIYDIIALYDIEGELVAANTIGPNGERLDLSRIKGDSVKEALWFKETLARRYSDDREKGLQGSYVEDFNLDPVTSAVFGDKRYGNSFSRAIINMEGNITGVLTARANFKWVEKEFQNLYQTIKKNGIETTELTMVNSKGEVIVDYDPVAHGGQTDIIHATETILKLNLAERGVEAVQQLVRGGSGHNTSFHVRKKVEQFTGFVSLKENPQFLSSLGWGVMARAEEADVLKDVYASVRPFYWFAGVFFIFAAVFAFFLSQRTSDQLVAVSGRLKSAADSTFNTSEELKTCATELAACNNQQAAAVQETVAAMEEMNSMINQSNDYIQEALGSAKKVSDRTEEGAQIMRRMVDAMESIQEANSQLQNMANIINEISAKTNVINDIVFKTQLLSFNASIEAARAGQHGRGFAVVAEEVGNLAQMSGAAAKEIKSLLDDSQKQVLSIVEVTKSRSEDGQNVSKEAQTTFEAIAAEIKTVSSQIENISDAAREQENGVQQTSVSMNKLDEATTRSAAMGHQISASALELGEQSSRMKQIMQATAVLVQGVAETTEKVKKARDEDVVDRILGDNTAARETRSGANKVALKLVQGSDMAKQKLGSLVGKIVNKVQKVKTPTAKDLENEIDKSPADPVEKVG